MSVLSLRRERMILHTKNRVPSNLATFKNQANEYSFPVCGDILRRLVGVDPEMLITGELREIFTEIGIAQRACLKLKGATDAPGRADLFDYQRVAVRWMSSSRRCILADAQGLGKTVEAVAAAQQFKPRRAIVIVPLIKISDWAHHIQEWIPGSRTLRFTGDATQRRAIFSTWLKQGGYLIMTFATMQIHEVGLVKALGKDDLMVIDEAHKLRNRKTGMYSTAKRISRKIGGVFLLTASPTVNAVEDIWALLSILDPIRFGSFWGFVYRFCEVESNGFGLEIKGLRSTEREALERIIAPYLLRREGMLDLADIKYSRTEYVMQGEQLKLYKGMAEDMECTYKGKVLRVWDKLAQITRLRQLALDPGLLFKNYHGPSKLNMLEDIIRERDGQVVIFTTYAKLVNLATKVLTQAGISVVSVFGGLSLNQRDEALASFKSGEARVIILTHGTGGEGLDLVEADRAIFLEYAWHPAGNEHAAKRIHRYGQTSRNIEITFLHTVGSIEDHIYDIIMDKKEVTIKRLIQGLRGTEHIGGY